MAIATEDEYGRLVNKRQQIEIKRKFKSIDKKHMKNKQKEKILKEFDKRFFIPMGYRNSHMADRLKQFFSQSLDSIREETLEEAFKAEMNGGGICKVEYKDEPKNKK